jgi:hypothetical protein
MLRGVVPAGTAVRPRDMFCECDQADKTESQQITRRNYRISHRIFIISFNLTFMGPCFVRIF